MNLTSPTEKYTTSSIVLADKEVVNEGSSSRHDE